MPEREIEGEFAVSPAELLDRVQVAVIVTDLRGRILQCNRQAEVVYGLSQHELLGRSSSDFAFEPVDPAVIAEIGRAMLEGRSWQGDFETRALDGAQSLVHAVNTPVFDRDGRFEGVVSASIDITDRVRLERRLRAQHAVALILAETDLDTDPTARILGVLGDALGFSGAGCWRPDDGNSVLSCTDFWTRDARLEHFAAASRGTVLQHGEGLPGRAWDHRKPVWVHDVVSDPNFPRSVAAEAVGVHSALASPVVAGDEVVAVIELYESRISEPDGELLDMMAAIGAQIGSFERRQRAERAAHASESRRSSMLEVALDAVVGVDDGGRITEFNPAAVEMFGYSEQDAFGQFMVELIVPVDLREAHRRGFRRFLETGQGRLIGTRVEIRAMRRDGEEFPVELSIAHIRSRDERGFTAYIRDITARVEAERALHDSYAETATLAHTLQQSLLPPELPDVGGVDIAALYLPAGSGAIGGDFYDVFERRRGEWIVAIGDVCGKGPKAATVAALARHTIRAAAMTTTSPSTVLGLLNRALLRAPATPMCSAVVARVRVRNGAIRLSLAIGGHPQPFRLSASGDVEMIGRPGTVLGVLEDVVHRDTTIELNSGETLLMYTDGVTELRHLHKFYGEPRLVALLQRNATRGPQLIINQIAASLRRFAPVLSDDVALIALQPDAT